MGKGAIAIGIICILAGILGAYEVLISEASNWILIHLFILIGIGIALIVFYKQEDKIEQRKDIKSKDK